MESCTTSPPAFDLSCLPVNDSLMTWGPMGDALPEFEALPMQPFNKSDKIGRVADWSAAQQYQQRTQQRLGLPEKEEEQSFQLVDTQSNKQKPKPYGYRQRFQQGSRSYRQQRGNFRGRGGYRRWDDRNQNRVVREPSVDIKPEWNVVEQFPFPNLQKLRFDPPKPESVETLYEAGTLHQYDASYDRISLSYPRTVTQSSRVAPKPGIVDDPVIRDLAQEGTGTIYASDAIVAALMACPRSIYSWDIIAHRVQNVVFLDKREGSPVDSLTVNENAHEPPSEDKESPNGAAKLSVEATQMNLNIAEQSIKEDGVAKPYEHENPFTREDAEITRTAYRYRRFRLSESLQLVVRCEVDSYIKQRDGKEQLLTVRSLNEYDPRVTQNWRQNLRTQYGVVLATEIKNNSYKLAKWIIQAYLAGSDFLKIGFTTRTVPRDPSRHTILGFQSFQPKEFAPQCNINLNNVWGVFKHIAETCLRLPEGKYLLMKDPNKFLMRLYEVPESTFEAEEDEDSDEESGAESGEEAPQCDDE
eukprot:gnl/Trimastix_PCT/572.p1 GENE.gnl/Trimastix_PCT/572~~gnl/Trimastix_PCT/572.p1  ORF type:complete len:541 (+),score=155.47 gnl/Trimastix_PCT/572:41-1624(+)